MVDLLRAHHPHNEIGGRQLLKWHSRGVHSLKLSLSCFRHDPRKESAPKLARISIKIWYFMQLPKLSNGQGLLSHKSPSWHISSKPPSLLEPPGAAWSTQMPRSSISVDICLWNFQGYNMDLQASESYPNL
ncbi:hypothetical protein M413DRAFT_187901 [Hebeloma cylindrosporum]|uniref:Uncharacterized protein n=1 Tax=Hebeloma cylindrosporum TaxID=76867 RepID=A0A0C3C8K7_HEBCY|nr:hypothetical protein M413DRAFT_187901 [Hebeloma cylindrosporum h7]